MACAVNAKVFSKRIKPNDEPKMIAFTLIKQRVNVINSRALPSCILYTTNGRQNIRVADFCLKKQNAGQTRRLQVRREKIILKISLRENKTANAKSPYHFYSENSGVLTFDELIDEMAKNNTTITKADIAGAMNVYKEVVIRYVQLGYKVYCPFGQVYICAKGTANDKLASFEPHLSGNDHDLNLKLTVDSSVAKTVLANTKTERVSGRYKMIPSIEEIQNVNGIALKEAKPGNVIRIIGEYLKLDENDSEQGIFLTKGDVSIRLENYIWNKNKRIDAMLPADIETGSYKVSIRAKPNTILYNGSFIKEITIS